MKLNQIGIRRLLRISSALVIAGLVLEIVSLLWFHPLSFVLFAFVAASLIGLGVLVFLASLVFAGAPPADNRN
jgi:hypothetical protein